ASAAPPAPSPAPPASAAPQAEVRTTAVTAVSNEITTPNVVSPDKVIQGLRPKFNACFAEGLKKDPKSGGSVTLSAKIEKDGKVSAVTPKMLTGFSPAVVKCVSDALKGASFAPAGGMNYTTSLDIPLSFTSNQ
ncbi:MAG TPA: AgmX/PglI C-terminal domain-containing protein, partial [Labilithrix sp.]|nr:AgmX/PglI C-terminal domain-containing protein [Labilithrix sp.]